MDDPPSVTEVRVALLRAADALAEAADSIHGHPAGDYLRQAAGRIMAAVPLDPSGSPQLQQQP